MVKLLPWIVLAALTGCTAAGGSSRFNDWAVFLVETAPVCSEAVECARMWDDAAAFVDAHSDYKLAGTEAGLLRTGPPVPATTGLAWTVTWRNLPDGRRKIIASAYCANRFGCKPDASETVLAFNCAVSRDATTCSKRLPPRPTNRPDQQ